MGQNEQVTAPAPFPKAPRGEFGYDPEEVDRALRVARERYENFDNGSGGKRLTAKSIRHTAFTMRKSGYSAPHVDAALERLEDAVAVREREERVAQLGQDAYLAETKDAARAVLKRIQRPAGDRFQRVTAFQRGYSVAEVDEFCDRVDAFLRGKASMTLREARGVAFAPKRRGYEEGQVDLLIDALVDVMLAIR
ncbi:DivIVA domain-containing protein [Gulosibacter macacae]|uniref:DivIVA domain-containing protein n=1 Tax=Gulosibacter macacae TaxID=2488791 RepID=A0A3P3VTD3_9MICO|nr:DivIVA domain-containing protein [Gulosibacter macacae]